jgi:hypothetical protein
MDILKAAQARMRAIDQSLDASSAPTTSSGGGGITKPPPGLSGDEEVAWWKNKIADLSGDPTAQSKKENSVQNTTPFSGSAKDTSQGKGFKAIPGAKATPASASGDAKGSAGEAKSYRK